MYWKFSTLYIYKNNSIWLNFNVRGGEGGGGLNLRSRFEEWAQLGVQQEIRGTSEWKRTFEPMTEVTRGTHLPRGSLGLIIEVILGILLSRGLEDYPRRNLPFSTGLPTVHFSPKEHVEENAVSNVQVTSTLMSSPHPISATLNTEWLINVNNRNIPKRFFIFYFLYD